MGVLGTVVIPKPSRLARLQAKQETRRLRQLQRQKASRQKRKNYGGDNWAKARAVVLERDNHRCVWCGATFNLTVAHLRHRVGMGGRRVSVNQPENLATLCLRCHADQEERRISVDQIEAKIGLAPSSPAL